MKCIRRVAVVVVVLVIVVTVVVYLSYMVQTPPRRPPRTALLHRRSSHSLRSFRRAPVPDDVEELFMAEEKEDIDEYDIMLLPGKPTPAPTPDPLSLEFTMPMVSDRTSTAHEWPWPGTKAVLEQCSKKYRSRKLADTTVSVVVCFHEDEELERLLHTVHSVWQRTPHALLHQIIIIDDGSVKDVFKSILTNYVKRVFSSKVILLRNERAEGLIRCRLRGVRAASEADIVACIDSHVEVQPGWLEPLVDEINQEPRTLASSSLDWMSRQDEGNRWVYKHGASTWKTVFDWHLAFSFQAISAGDASARQPTDPIKSPVMVGTAWAMDVSYMEEVGALDGGMTFWGGENIDLALRVWLMGGRVVNVPCSWVAHYESATSRAYRSSKEHLVHRNYRRLVDVWLGDYARYVYDAIPQLRDVDAGDLQSRLALKRKAEHTFGWYRVNVFPELGCPDMDSFAFGTLMNQEVSKCLTCHANAVPTLTLCDSTKSSQREVYWDHGGQLRLPLYTFKSHHHEVHHHATIKQAEATGSFHQEATLKWLHWPNGPLIEVTSGLCLTSFRMTETVSVMLATCRPGDAAQTWVFSEYTPSHEQIATRHRYEAIRDALKRAQAEWNM